MLICPDSFYVLRWPDTLPLSCTALDAALFPAVGVRAPLAYRGRFPYLACYLHMARHDKDAVQAVLVSGGHVDEADMLSAQMPPTLERFAV